MTASPFQPIQQAIYNILTNDSTLMTKVTGVFDFVPDNQAYPFVVIGEATSIPYETFDRHGEEVSITLHIWSRYLGMKEIDEIMNDCNRLLARQEFTVSGWMNINCYYDFGEVIREPDGEIKHGVLRYRVLALKE